MRPASWLGACRVSSLCALLSAAYYRGAMGILLVYDVTDEASYTNIRNWMRNIEQHASDSVNKACPCCHAWCSTQQRQSGAQSLVMPPWVAGCEEGCLHQCICSFELIMHACIGGKAACKLCSAGWPGISSEHLAR